MVLSSPPTMFNYPHQHYPPSSFLPTHYNPQPPPPPHPSANPNDFFLRFRNPEFSYQQQPPPPPQPPPPQPKSTPCAYYAEPPAPVTSTPQPQYSWMRNFGRLCGAGTNNVRVRTRDKYRMVYSDFQRLELEKEFCSTKYINTSRKTELSQALGLTERQIKIWFQNRRAKDRKMGKKTCPPSASPLSQSEEDVPFRSEGFPEPNKQLLRFSPYQSPFEQKPF